MLTSSIISGKRVVVELVIASRKRCWIVIDIFRNIKFDELVMEIVSEWLIVELKKSEN